MIYQSLFTFPAIFRKFAVELKPKGMSASDLLALLIARHWLTQEGIPYVSQAFELSDTGGMQLKPAIRMDNPDDPKDKTQWTLRIAGVEGSEAKAVWRLAPPALQYTHLWLWHIAPAAPSGATVEHFAHQWRGPVSEYTSWEMEPDGVHRRLALKDVLEAAPAHG